MAITSAAGRWRQAGWLHDDVDDRCRSRGLHTTTLFLLGTVVADTGRRPTSAGSDRFLVRALVPARSVNRYFCLILQRVLADSHDASPRAAVPFSRRPGRLVPTPTAAGSGCRTEPYRRRVRAVRDGQTVIDTEDVCWCTASGHLLSLRVPKPRRRATAERESEPLGAWLRPRPAGTPSGTGSRRAPVGAPLPTGTRTTGGTCRPTDSGLRVHRRERHAGRHHRHYDRVRDRAGAAPYARRPCAGTDGSAAPTTTTSYCKLGGYATTLTFSDGDTVVEDIAWSYPDPLPETLPSARDFRASTPAR